MIIALGFLIVLMQTKPYEEMDEDIMQTIATVSTCATLLIGFTLKVDRGASGEQAGEYDDAIIDIILILLFVGVGISGLYMIVKSLPWFAKEEEEKKEEKKENVSVDNTNGAKKKRRKLSRQLTMDQIKTAVVHGQVDRIQQGGEDLRNKFVDEIKKREKIADARVRQRLIERRKLKYGRDLRSWNLSKLQKQKDGPSDKWLEMVEKVRCKLKKIIRTVKNLRVVFTKLDVDASGMLGKVEFERLVSVILKKKSLDKRLIGLLWEAAWKQRKHGAEDELDSATLGHWLELDG